MIDNVELKIQAFVVGSGNALGVFVVHNGKRSVRCSRAKLAPARSINSGMQFLETCIQAFSADSLKELFERAAGRDRVIWEIGFAEFQFETATHGDEQCVLDRLGQITEQLFHFDGAAQILVLGVVVRPTWVIQRAALVDAHTHLVRLEIILTEKAHVIGGYDGAT